MFNSTLFWSLNGNPAEVRSIFENTGQTEATLIGFLHTIMDSPEDERDLVTAMKCVAGMGNPVPKLPENAKWLLDRWVSWDCDPALPPLLKVFYMNVPLSEHIALGALLRAGVPAAYLQDALDAHIRDENVIAEAWLAGASIYVTDVAA